MIALLFIIYEQGPVLLQAPLITGTQKAFIQHWVIKYVTSLCENLYVVSIPLFHNISD